jgi:hypothetical protein
MEKIQEDRELPRAPFKRRGSNVQTILAELLVATQGTLHGGHKLDRFHFGARSIDVAVFRKIRQHLHSPRHIPAPPLAWPKLLTTEAILIEKPRH